MRLILKQLFYKFTPHILMALSIILWLISFLLYRNTNIFGAYVWLPFLALQLVTSLICGKLIKKLYQKSYKDFLTSLGNRRYFYDRLSYELERSKRSKNTISMLMIDLDNFKNINDEFGHLVGDEFLKKVAKIIEENTRKIDIVARWGGEEFVVVLPETNIEGAKVLAERLRKDVENYDFGCRLTVSIGVAAAGADTSIENFLLLADQALYKAKEIKNKVMIAKD